MYRRLYFYAASTDSEVLLEFISSLGLYLFDTNGCERKNIVFSEIREKENMWYLSMKPPNEVRRDDDGKSFTSATYDVLAWRPGYIYKEYLIGNEIEQTLPRFKKLNPSTLDLAKFEDAKELRKRWNALRHWMKKHWVDYYRDGDFFGPEALRLKTEKNYLDQSFDPDMLPSERIIYVGEN